LKSIGVGLGIAGNPLRTASKNHFKNRRFFMIFIYLKDVNQLEPPMQQINPINPNPIQNIQPNVSGTEDLS
jgi:hypothetical protein